MYEGNDFYTEMEAEEQFLGSVWDWATGSSGSSNGRVDRRSKPYAKWVQRSLNKVAGLRLAVDGDIGTMTKSAIRDFQRKHSLKVDGIVGANTERALITAGADKPPRSSTPAAPTIPVAGSPKPYPYVNSLMPEEGIGFYCRMPASRRWALPETVAALKQIGRTWFMAHPSGPPFVISDISKHGGGKLCFSNGRCHKSHTLGLDLDMRLIRNDGKRTDQGMDYNSPHYSRKLTRQLIGIIRNNGLLTVMNVAFLDPYITDMKLSRWSGHGDHLHVRFCMPKKYRSVMDIRKTYSKPSYYYC